jgi:mono/diheme cytochrome c family protein
MPTTPPRRRGRLAEFLLTMTVTMAVTVAGAWSGAAQASPAQDYMLYCMGCHGAQAQGVPGKVPPLAHSIGLLMRSAAGRDYLMRVPGAANSVLSDAQLAAVLNWLAEEFNADELPADAPKFTAAEVGARRHVPLGSVLAARREVVRDLAATGAAPAADY